VSFASIAADPVLDALSAALTGGSLHVPAEARVLFMRAREGAALRTLDHAHWVCEQSFKPFADALGRSGWTVSAQAPAQRFPWVLVLPPRAREESRALMARALDHLEPGGTLVAAMANNEGARSGEADLARLAGATQSLSKHRCRVFWVTPEAADIDVALHEDWRALDAVQPILDGRFVSRPGLFAWSRIDVASALLAEHLPADLSGAVADLGGGYGYLSTEVLARCPGVSRLDLYEAEARALEPAQANLDVARRAHGREVALGVHWHDVTAGVPRRYDVVVSNPPFHQGKADQPVLGQAFIRVAAGALNPPGVFWMVANRHLPYEATLAECFTSVQNVAERDGFKVILAHGVRR
jgi:16S rRNA (guanine1207-N2)-methyltransferase